MTVSHVHFKSGIILETVIERCSNNRSLVGILQEEMYSLPNSNNCDDLECP